MKQLFFAVLFVAACSDGTSLLGAPCPCLDGYVCCAATNECLPQGSAIELACPQPKSELRCTLQDHGNGTGTIQCNNGTSFDVETSKPQPACGSLAGPLHYEGSFLADSETDLRLIRPFATISGDLEIFAATSSISLPCLERVIGKLEVDSDTVLKVDLPKLAIAGSIVISGPQLFDLRMPRLETIGHLLEIRETILDDLDGLNALLRVEQVEIDRNDALLSIAGLGRLEEVEYLDIRYNAQLENLDGLHLRRISESLSISSNDSLASLAGLAEVSELGDVWIASNPSLQSLTGLEGTRRVDDLQIRDNRLQDLSGLSNLQSAELISIHAEQIESLGGLSSGPIAVVSLSLGDNSRLASLDDLGRFILSGSITIRGNAALRTISLDFGQIEGELWIGDNRQLVAIDGTIRSVRGLAINDNESLERLEGFSQLSRVDSLRIDGNTALTSLTGFRALQQISSESLEIREQPQLTSLAGLEQLRGRLNVGLLSNEVLADVSALSGAMITNLSLKNNQRIQNINGLHFAENASLNVEDSPAFTDLSALRGVTALSYVVLADNNALTSLSGLNDLISIDSLSITGNNSLTSLADLNRLSSAESITIEANASLNMLSLGGLREIGYRISINGNTCLPQCSVVRLIEQLDLDGNESISTAGNKDDCVCDDQGGYMCMTGC